MTAVETIGLSKTYRSGFLKRNNIVALSDVSLSVSSGEIFGLLGPNGAGKTTFVKILLSIVHPSGGQATVLGHSLGTTKLRSHVGYLPENHRYPPFLSGKDTLLHFGRLLDLPPQVLQKRIDELLQTVGLAEWGNVKIKKFSKGMLQRLGIAQAMLNDPDIFFLDEPTDGVDPVGRKEIRDILKSLRSRGKTIFLNSHMLSEVEEISDRVAILNKGKVLQTGTIADITTTQLEYEIIVAEPPTQDLLDALAALCTRVSRETSGIHIAIRHLGDLERILNLLREKGFHLHALVPKKSKLEDYFIDLIKTRGAE